MSIVLPDNGIPVKVGDPSYIYNGIYDPIVWVGTKPYRPRVETLVIRYGREVFLKMRGTKNGVQTYELPGGSIDADSTKIQQAENEVNEEILVTVKNVAASGVQYYEEKEHGFALTHDVPLEYFGFVSDVYYAEYVGPFDKSKVEKKDLDPEMASGSWVSLVDAASILTEPHMTALMNCPFISDGIKGAMRLLRRNAKTNVLESTTEVESKTYYVASYVKLDNLELQPKVPNVSSSVFSNKKVARIEATISPETAIVKASKMRPSVGVNYFLYEVESAYSSCFRPCSSSQVPEVGISGEVWSLVPVRVKFLGEVVIAKLTGQKEYLSNFGVPSLSNGGYKKSYPMIEYTWKYRNSINQTNPTMESESPIIVPEKLYHGSTWEIALFKPMALDIGNAYQEPGWSTFCWSEYVLAVRFGLMRVIQNQLKKVKGQLEKDDPLRDELICGWDARHRRPYVSENCLNYAYATIMQGKYYVYTINPEGLELGVGNDFGDPEYTFKRDNVPPETVDTIYVDKMMLKEHLTVVRNWEQAKSNEAVQKELFPRYEYLSLMQRNFNAESVRPLLDAVRHHLLNPGDDVVQYMEKNGIVLEEIPFTSRMNNVVYESSGSTKPNIYFLSKVNKNDELLEPKVPDNYMTQNGFEDNTTPRVCFSTSIDGCLRALSQNLKDTDWYVHQPEDMVSYHKPTIKQVPDSEITGEVWVTTPVNLKSIGKIHISEAKNKGYSYSYGNNQTAELYDWSWSWVDKYDDEGISESVQYDVYTGEVMESDSLSLEIYKKSLIGKLVYHGSTERYDVLQPTGFDLGNALEEPGWSLYTWRDEYNAICWSIFQLLRKIDRKYNFSIVGLFSDCHITVIKEEMFNKLASIFDSIPPSEKIFYVYNIQITDDMKIGLGHSSNTNRCVTIKTPDVKPTTIDQYVLTMAMVSKYTKVVNDSEYERVKKVGINERGAASFLMTNDLMWQFMKNKSTLREIRNAINSGELQPGDSITEWLDNHNLHIEKIGFMTRLKTMIPSMESFYDENVGYNSNQTPVNEDTKRSELPDNAFGVPEQRKFPLDTEAHVRSAIRFFNYVEPQYEKELAQNILKAMKKFKMTDVRVSKKNRFSKYYHNDGVEESYEVVSEALIEPDISKIIHNLPYAQQVYLTRILDAIDDHHIVYRQTAYGMNHRPVGFIMLYMSATTIGVGHLLMYISPMYKDFRFANDLLDELKIQISKSFEGINVLRWRIPTFDNYTINLAKSYGFNKVRYEAWCDCKVFEINLSHNTMGQGAFVTDINTEPLVVNVEDAPMFESLLTEVLSLLPVTEADDDDDDEKAADYTQDADPDRQAPDDTGTDYTADAQDNPLSGGTSMRGNKDTTDTAGDDMPDDTGTDYTADADDPGDTDALQGNNTGSGDSSDLGDLPDDTGTDYTDGADDPEGDDTTDDETPEDDSTSTEDENEENDEDENSFGNNLIKNYNLLLDFERLSELTTEVAGTLEYTILPKPVQNKVLAQVVKNLNAIRDFIKTFIQFHFNESNYPFNLYYYNMVMQALELNLKMLEENKELGDDNKKKIKEV